MHLLAQPNTEVQHRHRAPAEVSQSLASSSPLTSLQPIYIIRVERKPNMVMVPQRVGGPFSVPWGPQGPSLCMGLTELVQVAWSHLTINQNLGKAPCLSQVWSKAGSHTVLCLEWDQVHHSRDGLPCRWITHIFISSICLWPRECTGGLGGCVRDARH